MSRALLKFAPRFFSIVAGASILLVLATCSQPSSSQTNPSDIASVGTVSPSALANSGATSTPSTLSATKAALSAIPSSDVLLNDIGTSLNTIGSMSITGAKGAPLPRGPGSLTKALSAFNGLVNKSLSSDITSQLSKIMTDIKNFPTSKSLNETINLNGDSLGQYIKLTTATSNFSASLVTSDGGPLNTSSMANFQSATGQATLSLVVDPQNLTGSAVKDFKLRINAGGSFSLGATTVNGLVQPANFVFDYAESAVLAFSFLNPDGITGGKVVITANAKNKGTLADPTTLGGNPSTVAPNITVSVTVCDDSGNTRYTQTWTDLASLVTDFSAP